MRRRRKLVARLRKLRQKSDAREGGRGRDGEDEEKAIWSLEAEEGASLYIRGSWTTPVKTFQQGLTPPLPS